MLTNKYYNEEYEKIILGILMLDNSLIDIVSGRLHKDCFYNAKNKFIYECILKQWNEKHCVNMLTLGTDNQSLKPAELAELTNLNCSTANWEFFVTEIVNLFTARRMARELKELSETVSGANTSEIIGELNSKIANYMQIGGSTSSNPRDLVFKISDMMQEAMNSPNPYLGYDCGFENLNDILDGFQTKQMVVVGARPSIGKTAFALSLLTNFCKKNIPTSFFSLEMANNQLMFRVLSSETRIPAGMLRKGLCLHSKEAVGKIQNCFRRMFEWPLNLYDTDIDNDSILFSKIRYEAKINGSKIIFIDHLGLIESSNSTGQRYVDVGKITKTLHKMAKELDVCIILLCQCGRAAEGKKPDMSLLRESGNIEQDADVIMFLHRDRDVVEKSIPTEVIVAKNRDGKLGTANMMFIPNFAKFVEDKGNNVDNEERGFAPAVPVKTQKPQMETINNTSKDFDDNSLF